MIVVNLYGGPGSGKSTTASAVFAHLKNAGCNVELVREFAKDLVYEKSIVLQNQLFVTANQYKRLKDLADYGVKVAITDSPLYLGKVYGTHVSYYPQLCELIDCLDSEFTNLNVFVNRVKEYDPSGRLQTAEESDSISEAIKSKMVFDWTVDGNAQGQEKLAKVIRATFGI